MKGDSYIIYWQFTGMQTRTAESYDDMTDGSIKFTRSGSASRSHLKVWFAQITFREVSESRYGRHQRSWYLCWGSTCWRTSASTTGMAILRCNRPEWSLALSRIRVWMWEILHYIDLEKRPGCGSSDLPTWTSFSAVPSNLYQKKWYNTYGRRAFI